MSHYKRSILDLPRKRLSPSALVGAIESSALPTCGGIGLPPESDDFFVNFAQNLSEEEETQLDEILAEHAGNGPDQILDVATVQAAKEAAEAEAEASA